MAIHLGRFYYNSLATARVNRVKCGLMAQLGFELQPQSLACTSTCMPEITEVDNNLHRYVVIVMFRTAAFITHPKQTIMNGTNVFPSIAKLKMYVVV